eukprot:346009_1
MFKVRFKFEQDMKLLISFIARHNNVYKKIGDDITKLILDYIPGKDGNLILTQNEIKNLKPDIQYEFENIKIPFAAHLKVNAWEPYKNRGGRLIINCFNTVQIDSGGSIDLSKSGYYGGRNALCCGGSYDHQGPVIKNIRSNTGAGGGGMVSGGASYGTKGSDGVLKRSKRKNKKQEASNNIWDNNNIGNEDTDTNNDEQMEVGYAGNVYGDGRISDLYIGSGGGSSYWSGGGRGGGALCLITNNLVNKGKIDCCGGDATESGSGGGSGGSIFIDVLGERECILGKIINNGGNGMNLKGDFKSYGGNGGNGRICINNKMLMLAPNDKNSPCVNEIDPKAYVTWTLRIDGNKYRL